MSFLSKEDILNQQLATEEVEVPEWGGTVCVRELTAKERLELGRNIREAEESGRVATYAPLAVGMALVDNNGNRLFEDEEIKKMVDSSGAAINKLYDVVARLSGLKPEKEPATKN